MSPSGKKANANALKVVNLKEGLPLVHQALSSLTGELARARQEGFRAVKFIHGYGSSGAGGEIRLAVQSTLQGLLSRGEVKAVVYGEHWAKSDEHCWKLLQSYPALKSDSDLGKRNLGITIVVL